MGTGEEPGKREYESCVRRPDTYLLRMPLTEEHQAVDPKRLRVDKRPEGGSINID